jgi:hypothetical protein
MEGNYLEMEHTIKYKIDYLYGSGKNVLTWDTLQKKGSEGPGV